MQGSDDNWPEKGLWNMTIDMVQGTLKAVEKKTELSAIFKPIGGV
jgi:hypothetical protein